MGHKLSALDKALKVRHLGGKRVTLTVSHVGIKRERKKSDIQIISGGKLEDGYIEEETAYLFWKEHGTRFPLLLNATNRDFVLKALGDDGWADKIIGKSVTIERAVHPAFKKEYVGIVDITAPKANGKPAESLTHWTMIDTEMDAFSLVVGELNLNGDGVKDILQVTHLRDYKGTRAEAEKALRDAVFAIA